MPRRIDIELTSSRDDGTWTWRAAGAKAPKGSMPATVVPEGAKVGDVLKVDAEFFVDGISITGVVTSSRARKEPELLELIAPTKEEPLVTTTLASRGRDDRGPRRDGPRRDGPRRDGGPRGDREGGPRREGERSGARRGPAREGDRQEPAGREGERREGGRPPRKEGASRPPRRTRPEPPPMPAVERPKAKRLRAGKVHRGALLESLPEEQRPIAEQVVLGGLPAVRQAIEKQNAERAAAGETAIAAGPLLEMAEKLVPKVRAAEWRDRAEAAQKDLDVIDLRDLRSVVSAADAGGKDEEARALAHTLKEGLVARVDAEHTAWLTELNATLDVGRIVRALRLSSRPPKAGSPLPKDVATRLTTMAGEALTTEAAPERWVAVLDALAFAPVRDKVIPTSLPKELHADVQATIARLATRIPKIAHIFEITPDRNAPRPKAERRRPPKPKKPGEGPKGEGKREGGKPRSGPPKDAAPAAEGSEPQATDEAAPTTEVTEPAVASTDASVPAAEGSEPQATDEAVPTTEVTEPAVASTDASEPAVTSALAVETAPAEGEASPEAAEATSSTAAEVSEPREAADEAAPAVEAPEPNEPTAAPPAEDSEETPSAPAPDAAPGAEPDSPAAVTEAADGPGELPGDDAR